MRLRSVEWTALALSAFVALPASAQTITVTTAADSIDINAQTATVADLPGPDGVVSFSEAMIAANNTPGHQTVAFAIPQNEWILQFIHPGCAVLNPLTGFYYRSSDQITIDGTTQTAFTGDTNPDGWEVAIYGADLSINGDDSTLIGFHSTPIFVTGSNALIQGNTGTMNITVGGGSGSLIKNNTGGTIKIDRSSDNVVVGNTIQRVRVLGFGTAQPAANNRIGGPDLSDRNFITGYGYVNGEGLPGGTTLQLADTAGTIIENNWIGTTPDGLAQGSLASSVGIGFQGENDNTTIRNNRIAGILGHGQGPHHAGQLFGWSILVGGSGSGLSIVGNTIGLDANGDPLLGSVWGIDVGNVITSPSTMSDIQIGGTLPGEGNVVAGHYLNGITVGHDVPQVRISNTTTYANGWLGIDLIPTGFGYGVTPNDPLDADTGGNDLQNFPVIDGATMQGPDLHVAGSLHTSPLEQFTIELFASPACDDSGFGEGQAFLGTLPISTDAGGNATFDTTVPAGPALAGWVVTATATREPLGATSEFSACFAIAEPCECDMDGDGRTSVFDFAMFVGNFGAGPGATHQMGDFDGDGYVTVSDFATFTANFGCES